MLGLVAGCLLLAIGAVIHRLMGAGSCGPAGNAILVAAGLGIAFWVDPRRRGVVVGSDLAQFSALSALLCVMVLATAGTLKTWLAARWTA